MAASLEQTLLLNFPLEQFGYSSLAFISQLHRTKATFPDVGDKSRILDSTHGSSLRACSFFCDSIFYQEYLHMCSLHHSTDQVHSTDTGSLD
jgi:hypothetical protein